MTHIAKIIVLIGTLILMSGKEVEATTEDRCTALGVNCVCSAPFTGTMVVTGSKPVKYSFSDSTKPCSTIGAGNSDPDIGVQVKRTYQPTQDLTMTSDATIIGALPAGHTVTEVLRSIDGGGGDTFMGHGQNDLTTGVQRMSMRWYWYMSPNWSFTWGNNLQCTNGKVGQFMGLASQNPAGPTLTMNGWGDLVNQDAHGPSLTYYDWQGVFDNSVALGPRCNAWGGCTGFSVGPYVDQMPSMGSMKGKWQRWEIVTSGHGVSGSLRIQVYFKNITDNGPELLVIDTASTLSGNNNTWASHPVPMSWYSSGVRGIAHEPYQAGTCPGFSAWTHLLVSRWTTDAGQRIGAAKEVEGGGGDSVAPTTPQGLKIQ